MDRIIEIADGFWNIRGSFRLFGVVDIGTHASLARLRCGGFALLDSYSLTGEVARRVMALTDRGSKLKAILNLHPFHTVHVPRTAALFPKAKLFGTKRHHRIFPNLPWQPELTESEALAQRFAHDFDFTVPMGVSFIPSNENLHFSSVLAIHRNSETLHVDDTLNWVPWPLGNALSFHPTLGAVLERTPGAAADFRTWAMALIERCARVRHICTAHAGPAKVEGPDIADQIRRALDRVEPVLARHEARV